jgi:hypothetical protein
MMQMLYAAFLSLSIIGIPAVSARVHLVYLTSGDAPNRKCLSVPTVGGSMPVEMLVHSGCPTVNDNQLMELCYIDTIATSLPQNDGMLFCRVTGENH